MPAGRGRPQRAADMKKDVRILLVGERESARAGVLAAAAAALAAPLPFRAPGPPSSSALLFRLRPSTSRLSRALLRPLSLVPTSCSTPQPRLH